MEMSALLPLTGKCYDHCDGKKLDSRKGSYYFMFDNSNKRIPRKNVNFNWT